MISERLIEIKPFVHLTEVELAWAAGFIDGEGCITILKYKAYGKQKSPTYKIAVIVANTNRPSLERLMQMFGVGSIQAKNNQLQNSRCKQSWVWNCQSGNAKTVLEAIKPYLFVKVRDAEIALEFCDLPKAYAGKSRAPDSIINERERLYNLIREGRRYCGNNGSKPKVRIPEQELLV